MKMNKYEKQLKNALYISFFAVIDYVICWRAFELFTEHRLTALLAGVTCIGMIVISLIGVAWLQDIEGEK